MKSVKLRRVGKYDRTLRLDDYEPKHLGYLIERLTRRSRRTIYEIAGAGDFEPDRYAPLTPGYFRLLSLVPADGARVTDLARLSSMTKQALGQFVRVLEAEGYATTAASPTDRRVRIVRRTALGDEVVAVTDRLWSDVEKRWRHAIGADRWDVFHGVLLELATGWDPNETSEPE